MDPSNQQFSSNLFMSSKSLGRSVRPFLCYTLNNIHIYILKKKLSAKKELRQALNEHRQGLPTSVPGARLFVESEHVDVSDDGEDSTDVEDTLNNGSKRNTSEVIEIVEEAHTVGEKLEVPKNPVGSSLKVTVGSALKTSQGSPKKKAKVKFSDALKASQAPAPAKPSFQAFNTSDTSDSESGDDETTASTSIKPKATPLAPLPPRALSPEIEFTAPEKKSLLSDLDRAFHVPVHRTEEIAVARIALPVVGEEQNIMETIMNHDVVLLCGETGSGKTTQVPQFLYEAGFGDPKHPHFPGMVGVTQPRRVAAISMANRIADEMNLKNGQVSYQVRYDKGQVGANTRIKFMTDGILLRELSESAGSIVNKAKAGGSDVLLSKYSCIIIDEAHERTVGTDVLLGWLTRIVRLRNSGKVSGIGHLKLVIMSATLRVQDFTENKTLFPDSPPPVINVQGRQHKVVVHYNRRTETDYVGEAYKKAVKIHKKLPEGGILIFMTGQQEIQVLVKKLRKAYPLKAKLYHGEETVESDKKEEDDIDLFGHDLDNIADDYQEQEEKETDEKADSDDEEEEVQVLGGNVDDEDTDVDLPFDRDDEEDRGPLYVLPLYSMLPTAAQLRVFQTPPPGARLCVIATNVAETSLTIPRIKYVIDTGKSKERKYDSHSGLQTFAIDWTSRASADQRAGRAGRIGPGHCYRLFSSAVFANQFEDFSSPEILRVPIDGVVLQMKAVGISQVVNFPFPTVPNRHSLVAAEKLLTYLGGIEGSPGKITLSGKLMSHFPVSPRFGKMILLAAQQKSAYFLGLVLTLVAGLSVGDPFIRDDLFSLPDDDEDEEDGKKKMTRADQEAAAAESEDKRKRKGSYYKTMASFSGQNPQSDVLRLLSAIGSFTAEARVKSGKALEEFCTAHFLRLKSLEEMVKLQTQLFRIAKDKLSPHFAACKELDVSALLAPPSAGDKTRLRQVLFGGYPDRLARLVKIPPVGYRSDLPLYETMWSSSEPGDSSSEDPPIHLLHSTSSFYAVRPPPEYIVYDEIQGKSLVLASDQSSVLGRVSPVRKFWLKGITSISESWIPVLGSPSLVNPGRVLDQPEPAYDSVTDGICGYVHPSYGPSSWELSLQKTTLSSDNPLIYRYFAKALLSGEVFSSSSSSPQRRGVSRSGSQQKNVGKEDKKSTHLFASMMVCLYFYIPNSKKKTHV